MIHISGYQNIVKCITIILLFISIGQVNEVNAAKVSNDTINQATTNSVDKEDGSSSIEDHADGSQDDNASIPTGEQIRKSNQNLIPHGRDNSIILLLIAGGLIMMAIVLFIPSFFEKKRSRRHSKK